MAATALRGLRSTDLEDSKDSQRVPWRGAGGYLYGLYFSTDLMDFKDFCVQKVGRQSLESLKSVEKKRGAQSLKSVEKKKHAVLRILEVRREKKTRNAAHTDGIGKETGRFVQFVVEKFGNVGNYLYLCSVFFD